jgi:hypothetical protein
LVSTRKASNPFSLGTTKIRSSNGAVRGSGFTERIGIGDPVAVLLPLDKLFDIRAAAALRLWRALIGRTPGPDLGVLTPERRSRLILALRALDGRFERATYPEIAAVLFDTAPISKRDWISHELRDQTGRIIRLGFSMMRGGYRRLLLHPYRRRV